MTIGISMSVNSDSPYPTESRSFARCGFTWIQAWYDVFIQDQFRLMVDS